MILTNCSTNYGVKMRSLLSVIIVLMALAGTNLYSQIFNEPAQSIDTSHAPVIDIVPAKLVVENDTSRFLELMFWSADDCHCIS